MIFFIFSFFIIQCIIADETEAYQLVLNWFFYCEHARQPDDKPANKDWNQKFQEAG